jgi:hypothetical protein
MFTRSAKWIAGVLLGALALVITGTLTGIPGQLLDRRAIEDKLRSGPDLRIDAEIVALNDEGGPSLVFSRGYQTSRRILQEASEPMRGPSVVPSLRAAGGINLETLTIQLVLEGRRNEEIRILDIQPVIVARTAPLDGTLFFLPPQGGVPTLQMVANLDSPIPVIDTVGSNNKPTHEPYFDSYSISLHDAEQQTLTIRATTERFNVAFTLRVRYAIGGHRETETITDNGHPFRVSAPHCVGAGIASYQHVVALQGNFSALPTHDPHHFQIGPPQCT